MKLLPWYFCISLLPLIQLIIPLLNCLLDWFGVGGSTSKWFSSYLTEHYQPVKIGSTLSDLQKLLFSIPQGSVLGPLLFSLYTSPLRTLIGKHKGINFHFYANNTQLYVHLSHMNASAAFDKLNRCLQDVKEGMLASKLKLNPDNLSFGVIRGYKKSGCIGCFATCWFDGYCRLVEVNRVPSQGPTFVILLLLTVKKHVTPLIKKASLLNEDFQNYRLVSGLCFMSKLVEWVVVKQLKQHINSINLENPRQSAYKSGHTTETTLMHIKNEFHLSLSQGEPTALVLLDLLPAFDTIDHTTLLNCLKSWFGVCGTALKWFTSYLSHLFQAIKIGSTLSELHELLFGVPQGSVFGPMLFSLYTTPLSKVIGMHPDIKYHFYADDTQLFIHVSQKCSPGFDKLKSCLLDIQKLMLLSVL